MADEKKGKEVLVKGKIVKDTKEKHIPVEGKLILQASDVKAKKATATKKAPAQAKPDQVAKLKEELKALKDQVKQLKTTSNAKPITNEAVVASVKELTFEIKKLNTLFDTANVQFKTGNIPPLKAELPEEIDSKLNRISKQMRNMSVLIDQNEKIAKALLAMAEMIKGKKHRSSEPSPIADIPFPSTNLSSQPEPSVGMSAPDDMAPHAFGQPMSSPSPQPIRANEAPPPPGEKRRETIRMI